ncbi:hypothetical protein GQ607_011769 [Colletotrichum asianum]|uniref:Uncharacterized protein n=1 Tax=Colletotrichum asianum TaxID=702518 RepID=A0A8H3ZP67_9PEZI|nr:hypothetical protein GQ607_011769 [Colletotrichum asianum]
MTDLIRTQIENEHSHWEQALAHQQNLVRMQEKMMDHNTKLLESQNRIMEMGLDMQRQLKRGKELEQQLLVAWIRGDQDVEGGAPEETTNGNATDVGGQEIDAPRIATPFHASPPSTNCIPPSSQAPGTPAILSPRGSVLSPELGHAFALANGSHRRVSDRRAPTPSLRRSRRVANKLS